jgi:hypothetical protein
MNCNIRGTAQRVRAMRCDIKTREPLLAATNE